MSGSEVAIKVAVRVRPFSRREMVRFEQNAKFSFVGMPFEFSVVLQEQNQKTIVRVLDESNLMFDPDEDEDEFFFHGSKDVPASNGLCNKIFAFRQTNASRHHKADEEKAANGFRSRPP